MTDQNNSLKARGHEVVQTYKRQFSLGILAVTMFALLAATTPAAAATNICQNLSGTQFATMVQSIISLLIAVGVIGGAIAALYFHAKENVIGGGGAGGGSRNSAIAAVVLTPLIAYALKALLLFLGFTNLGCIFPF